MEWIYAFQLFLFDFDGLLVDTETLHYLAYLEALKKRGLRLNWNFAHFCQKAHLDGDALREALCSLFPELTADWENFYAEKTANYRSQIAKGEVRLMPGVEKLLIALDQAKIERCTVTHSGLMQTRLIRTHLPILDTIPHWITREDYKSPKPAPECYLKAISLYSKPGDRIIGFEDSLRGLEALKHTPATAVLICSSTHPLLTREVLANNLHFESFEELSRQKNGPFGQSGKSR